MENSTAVERFSSARDGEDEDLNPEIARPTLRILALFETATISGPAKNLFQFCRAARTLSTGPAIDIRIVTFERSLTGGQNSEFAQMARRLDLPLHVIPEKFPYDGRVIGHLKKLKEELMPDLIETHAVKSHAVLRASGLWRETPWIAFHHGYTRTAFHSPLYNRVDRWSLPVAARVVTMNRDFQRQLVQHGVREERTTVLHNAVQLPAGHARPGDAAGLQPSKSRMGIASNEKVILCVGRLSHEKGHIDMVAAMQRLRKMRPDRKVRLILVGDGPERGRISEAVQSAELGDCVMFAGQLKDVAPYYDAADVVAIPSLSEGSPNVLLEAMAFGVPVVATAVGGIPEIVTNRESALLVPPRNPGALAEAIDELLSNPGSAGKMARQAREKVERDYSPESRAKALLEIYMAAQGSASKTIRGTAAAIS